MSKPYRPWNFGQSFLLPPSPMDWLPDDHLVFFLLDVVQNLDISAIESVVQRRDPRGNPPFHPRMMVTLLLYGYCIGVSSSRQLERATYEDVAFRVLTGGQHPNYSVISEFRRVHLEALKSLFLQTVKLCQHAGLVKLGRVALDGTKVQANASKHKAMSYERMLKSEEKLVQEIAALLAEAERLDNDEDARHGNRRGDELPDELKRREDRLRKIREAQAKLEEEAARTRAGELREQAARHEERAAAVVEPREQARAAARAAKAREQAQTLCVEEPAREPSELPGHKTPATSDGTPTPTAQRNFTDPDSRIMKRDGAYLQGYNCQIAVDEEHQVIVSCAATNQAPDVEHLPPLLVDIEQSCGVYPGKLLADTGYWSAANVDFCVARKVDAYIATERYKHGEVPPPVRGRIPAGLDAKGRMRRKLRTKKGRAVYAQRKAIVEPVFGQIKQARGMRQFLLRGLDKVRAEWALFCAGHNLLKLYRSGAATAA